MNKGRARYPPGRGPNNPAITQQSPQKRTTVQEAFYMASDQTPGSALAVPGTSPTFAERVFKHVDTSGDCWEWLGAKHTGYGVIGRGERGTGNIQAHRAVWELLVGPIPDGLQFDHLCRNRGCVNPGHGELVTPAENKRRGYSPAAFHALLDTCDKGHPKDGRLGARGGKKHNRYCKTCARQAAAKRKAVR